MDGNVSARCTPVQAYAVEHPSHGLAAGSLSRVTAPGVRAGEDKNTEE